MANAVASLKRGLLHAVHDQRCGHPWLFAVASLKQAFRRQPNANICGHLWLIAVASLKPARGVRTGHCNQVIHRSMLRIHQSQIFWERASRIFSIVHG
jgi:hypothetical protein